MKKLVYIFSIFVAILLLNSCNKEIVNKCDDKDPFAIEDNTNTRGANDDDLTNGNGGIIDPDEDDDDMDEDDDTIIDPDEDDDDMDEDDDSIEGKKNGSQGV